MSERAESLLEQLLQESVRANCLLEQMVHSQQMLIAALAEDDPEAEPMTYMDGSPVR